MDRPRIVLAGTKWAETETPKHNGSRHWSRGLADSFRIATHSGRTGYTLGNVSAGYSVRELGESRTETNQTGTQTATEASRITEKLTGLRAKRTRR